MERIRLQSIINGKPCWTLFDTGSRNTYITQAAAQGLVVKNLPKARTTRLGGKVHTINQSCLLLADIEGHTLDIQASVIDEIGNDEDGREIGLFFGALAMQQWGIRLDVPNEKLDWTHFTTDFLEF